MISELTVGNSITGEILYCTSKTSGVSKNGSTYYNVVLRDKSGQINGKIWDVSTTSEDIVAPCFLRVTGIVNSFNNENQLNIQNYNIIDESIVNIEDFCPITPLDIDKLVENLFNYIGSVKNEYLNKLLHQLFDNETIKNKFKKSSAAKTVHHAYIGGLLEHTIAVTNICDMLAKQYPNINRDLLITAAICHDIGKIKEITEFPINDYSDEGNLLGHIYLGAEMINNATRKIEGFPKSIAVELKHCILAHHGGLEYGSPKVPALIEATALSFADDTDAKLRRFNDLLDTAGDSWSDKSDYFLGSRYRKTTL